MGAVGHFHLLVLISPPTEQGEQGSPPLVQQHTFTLLKPLMLCTLVSQEQNTINSPQGAFSLPVMGVALSVDVSSHLHGHPNASDSGGETATTLALCFFQVMSPQTHLSDGC